MHHAVGVLQHPLEPVLGHQHGDAEVVHEAGHGGEHLLGRGRVERRGRLVEDEHPRVRREDRADGRALLLPAGQRRQRAVADVGEPEQVEHLLDPLAHHVGRQPQLLHAVGELLLQGVGHEAGERVLADDPDEVGELARRVRTGVAPVDEHPAAQGAAGEVRDQAVDRAEQGRLAGAGGADRDAQLALGHDQVDLAQGRCRGARVGDADALEADHAKTSCGRSTVARTGGGADTAGTRPTRTASSGSSGRSGQRSG